MRKLKWRGAQGTHGKQGDRVKRLLKLVNSKSKKINLTMKLSKKKKQEESKSKQREGLVLAKQVLEPLRAMLDAFEARLKLNQTLEETL